MRSRLRGWWRERERERELTEGDAGECQTPLNIERSLISLRYSTAVDIITDVFSACPPTAPPPAQKADTHPAPAVIAIPVWLCWQINISLKQKLGLYAVLCLGVVIIVFSVVRIIVTNVDGVHPEVSWLAMWSSIESSVAVIVACLASFKAILTHRQRAKTGGSGSGAYRKHAHGSDSRSGGDQGRGTPYQPSREEHEMQAFGGLGRAASGEAVLDVKKPGVSEESIELRQASFESQAQILRRP